jgi:hypothetical protein
MRLQETSAALEALGFPARTERSQPDRALVLEARALIEAAVADDGFLAGCIALEIARLAGDKGRRGLTPFLTLPRSGIRLAFGFWPPGGTPGPHEHTAWTITGVCRNALEVRTFDRDASYRRRELVPKSCFEAAAGRVGYIYNPSIHAPINRSHDWSLSLHVTSPRDGERPDGDADALPGLAAAWVRPPAWQGHPYAGVVAARRRMKRAHLLARTLAAMSVPQAPALLARAAGLGRAATRRLTARRAGTEPGAADGGARLMLRRTHPGLVLDLRRDADMVALMAQTPDGPREELAVDARAQAALAFAAREQLLDARALPGPLTMEERTAIAEALEEAGLFTPVVS